MTFPLRNPNIRRYRCGLRYQSRLRIHRIQYRGEYQIFPNILYESNFINFFTSYTLRSKRLKIDNLTVDIRHFLIWSCRKIRIDWTFDRYFYSASISKLMTLILDLRSWSSIFSKSFNFDHFFYGRLMDFIIILTIYET